MLLLPQEAQGSERRMKDRRTNIIMHIVTTVKKHTAKGKLSVRYILSHLIDGRRPVLQSPGIPGSTLTTQSAGPRPWSMCRRGRPARRADGKLSHRETSDPTGRAACERGVHLAGAGAGGPGRGNHRFRPFREWRPRFGHHPKDGSPQGIFCANGQCAQCLVLADGMPVKSCMELVRPGLRVEPADGLPELPKVASAPGMREIQEIEIPVLIIGGGPAGMSAAIQLGQRGIRTLLVDDKHRLGGKLVLQTHRFFGSVNTVYAGTRGIDIATRLERGAGNRLHRRLAG